MILKGYSKGKGFGIRMISFEEELEKFQPSLEVEQAEEAIYNNDLTDVMDFVKSILKSEKDK